MGLFHDICLVSGTDEGVPEGKLAAGVWNALITAEHSATLSTEYPTCTALGLDPDMRGERPRLVTEPEKERKGSLTACHTVSTGGDGRTKSNSWLDNLAEVRSLRHGLPLRYGSSWDLHRLWFFNFLQSTAGTERQDTTTSLLIQGVSRL